MSKLRQNTYSLKQKGQLLKYIKKIIKIENNLMIYSILFCSFVV